MLLSCGCTTGLWCGSVSLCQPCGKKYTQKQVAVGRSRIQRRKNQPGGENMRGGENRGGEEGTDRPFKRLLKKFPALLLLPVFRLSTISYQLRGVLCKPWFVGAALPAGSVLKVLHHAAPIFPPVTHAVLLCLSFSCCSTCLYTFCFCFGFLPFCGSTLPGWMRVLALRCIYSLRCLPCIGLSQI